MSDQWVKLGRISLTEVPKKIFDFPIVEAVGHSHEDASVPTGTDFWFKRTHSTILTITHGAATEYLHTLDLPKFPFRGANFLSMTETLGWHIDKNRVTTLNVALLNGNLGRVEFEDGSSYVMEDGDVYCLDVSKKHRIVIEEGAPGARLLLNIGLLNEFHSAETQQIIKDITDYITP
jgi:hypothetical protein